MDFGLQEKGFYLPNNNSLMITTEFILKVAWENALESLENKLAKLSY